MSKFKVVTDSGVTLHAGAQPKDAPKPFGLDKPYAQSRCDQVNAKAEELGIQTRYKVVPLEAA